MAAQSLKYKSSGVDIDVADQFIQKIKPLIKTTERPEVLSSIGHYAGLFRLDKDKYRSPVLVASTDGVGTKLRLALQWNRLEGLGQDLVAMSANDLLCLGAEPLFFLDYFATGKLHIEQAATLLKSITGACREIGCTLLGGETAEMPSLYRKGDFDLAGFLVGVVEQDQIIDGARIRPGDKLVGLSSSGIHSNGFSLIRKIVTQKKLLPRKKYPSLSKSLDELLLAPTHLYGSLVLPLRTQFDLRGLAHITGGGFWDNIPRILPKDCRVVVRRSSWKMPALFEWIQKMGHISEEEMFRVFNCGIGLVAVVPAEQAEPLARTIRSQGQAKGIDAWVIGEVLSRNGKDKSPDAADPIEIL